MHNRFFRHISYSLLLLSLFISSLTHANEVKLPELGDSSSSIVSQHQEHQLGENWLRVFRSQVRTLPDPQLQDYLVHLIYNLATHSQLKDRRLELVVVDNKAINAFAVPGGIIGIHSGLLLNAKTEDELAAVLAHELAHLSQRHFARGVEEQQRAALPNMAALLASLVIIATSGGDAGLAALTAAQAASIQSQLRFSRDKEREADRIGMETMVRSDFNPAAIASMFEHMQRAARYAGNRPPEFLLTHPVTESRIADSRNQASQYPKKPDRDSLGFHLMKARIQLHISETPLRASKQFRAKLGRDSENQVAAKYGLAIALTASGKLAEAENIINELLKKRPNEITFYIAKANIMLDSGRFVEAIKLLEKQLSLNPNNHPLTMSYADILVKVGDPRSAEKVLVKHTIRHPKDSGLWYKLAETHGMAGNIIGVHQARAEYFILNAVLDQAQRQLRYALELVENDYHNTAKIQARIRDIDEMKKQMNF